MLVGSSAAVLKQVRNSRVQEGDAETLNLVWVKAEGEELDQNLTPP